MAYRPQRGRLLAAELPAWLLGIALVCGLTGATLGGQEASAQVFVVGEKSAMANVSTEFHPTRIELPSTPITERGRQELLRDLMAEEGFAHRALPLGQDLVLVANGKLTPSGDAYKQMLYKKGQSAAPGDRVAITAVTVKDDRIVLDLDGGPYVKYRLLRHLEMNDVPIVPNDGAQATGCRLTLLFEGEVPAIGAEQVKALLGPVIDFDVTTPEQAYADTLPPFLKNAIEQHAVLVGMDRRMVLATMGEPRSKVRELIPGSKDKQYEDWIYGQMPQTVRFVRFVGDRVTQLRIAEAGKPIVVHDKDEMRGYLAPDDSGATHELALGDTKPGNGEDGKAKPPTLLKPGESAPGSQKRVLLPVPDDKSAQDKSAPTDSSATRDKTSDQPATGPTN